MLSLKLHESDVCDGQNDAEVLKQGKIFQKLSIELS